MTSYVVTGLGFGDEGKGSFVDHLCRRHGIKTVVRFNGGAQALHHVTTTEGVTHGFSQFGSHTFLPGARTLLSRFMLIEPLALMQEARELQGKGVTAPLRSLIISAEAPIIPYMNVLLNRVMESYRDASRHGSCGLGIGLTQQDVEELGEGMLRIGDLLGPRDLLMDKLRVLHDRALTAALAWESVSSATHLCKLRGFSLSEYAGYLHEFARRVFITSDAAMLSVIGREQVVFEGAQGALLDQHHGLFPHCTRSTTTTANADVLLAEAGQTSGVVRYGLLRAYGTRHGAGPFPTETPLILPSCDNTVGEWQGEFRLGWFDAVLVRTALTYTQVDGVVLTNLDRLDGQQQLSVATAYSGMSDRFYDREFHRLRLVADLEESRTRTAEIFAAEPNYDVVPGWCDGNDSAMEQYVRWIETLIGAPIVVLSRRKDHEKVYR